MQRSRGLNTALMLGMLAGMGAMPPVLCESDNQEPVSPRQPEVNELSKKARKVYSKVLIETQDREKALAAALEFENGTSRS